MFLHGLVSNSVWIKPSRCCVLHWIGDMAIGYTPAQSDQSIIRCSFFVGVVPRLSLIVYRKYLLQRDKAVCRHVSVLFSVLLQDQLVNGVPGGEL